MHQLITDFFVPAFELSSLNDSAVVAWQASGRVALTTDSYVVSPYFFPGGDIGLLSVCGTVNDLAMAGAKPLYMTVGFILEEGLPLEDLKRVLASMKSVSEKIGIRIVAGDTKVVEKGKGDGIYINTAGVGLVHELIELSPKRIKPGDKVIISGSIGNHGIAVMAERSGITFDPPLLSDVCPLNGLVDLMLEATGDIRVMRDPTRGGVATTLKEFANDSGYCLLVHEETIRVRSAVQGACDLLGLDPLYVANEGVLLAVVAPAAAEDLVAEMRKTSAGADAFIAGEVTKSPARTVLYKTILGGNRIIDMLSGEQLPRIC